ncbi:MAG: hypothetical protein M0D55_10120 [Elusimicrobiota bacterium]|nr:MAG: hypothetical protein M0D55_10120 [Elusimicrobiota bacterium]
MTKIQIKWLGLFGLITMALLLLYPSVTWYYGMDAEERAKAEALRERPKWLVNLGLDLKGGTHMVMELDVEKLDKSIPRPRACSRPSRSSATASTSSASPSL